MKGWPLASAAAQATSADSAPAGTMIVSAARAQPAEAGKLPSMVSSITPPVQFSVSK